MTSNPRHGLPPRLMAHQSTRFANAQESKPSPSPGIRISRLALLSFHPVVRAADNHAAVKALAPAGLEFIPEHGGGVGLRLKARQSAPNPAGRMGRQSRQRGFRVAEDVLMTVKAFALSVAFSAAVGAPSAWSQTQEAEEQTCSSQLEECKAYCSSLRGIA